MSQKVYLTLDELKDIAAYMGFELRRKGRRVEKRNETDADGNPIKNCFMPHYRVTASGCARLHKVTEKAKAVFGYQPEQNGEVWEDKLVLTLEHVVRWLEHKIDEREMQACIKRLTNPLPKSEYLKRKNAAKGRN